MHYAVTKEDLKGGFNIYNWHDDSDDMSDVSNAELIGHVSKDGKIDADYLNDELAFDGVIEALFNLGFTEKAEEIKKEFFANLAKEHGQKQTDTKASSVKIIWNDEELKNLIYKEMEKFLTYEYAADIYMDIVDEVLFELYKLKANQYEWLYFYDIHHAIGAVLANKMAVNYENKNTGENNSMKKLYLNTNMSLAQATELIEHLSFNNYEAKFETDFVLTVPDDEIYEVQTILQDRNIGYTDNIEDVPFKSIALKKKVDMANALAKEIMELIEDESEYSDEENEVLNEICNVANAYQCAFSTFTVSAPNSNITEIEKDLLATTHNIIAHQVNCKGVMGAGVAKQIKEKLLSNNSYCIYQEVCKARKPENLLGTMQLLISKDGKQYIANLFGENIPTGTGLDTDYDALEKALHELYRYASLTKMSVAFPGYLGCGLAGGDWNIVKKMIYDIFGGTSVKVEICYLPGTMQQAE